MKSTGAAECGLTFMISPNDIELDDITKDLLERCWDMFLRDPDHFIREERREWKGYRMYRCEREGKNIGLLENPDLLEYVFFAVWSCDPKSQRFLYWQVRQTARLQKLLIKKNIARPERGVTSDSLHTMYRLSILLRLCQQCIMSQDVYSQVGSIECNNMANQ
jgi:hypothetical protein